MQKNPIRTIVLLITYCLLLLAVVLNLDSFLEGIDKIFAIIKPILGGIALAFLLNIFMEKIEKWLDLLTKKRKNTKVKKKPSVAKRRIALILTVLCFLGMLALVLALLIPQIISSISLLVEQIPALWSAFRKELLVLEGLFIEWDIPSFDLTTWIDKAGTWATSFLNRIVSSTAGITGSLANVVVSFVISIYLLLNKEVMLSQMHRLVIVVAPKRIQERLFHITRLSLGVLRKFVTGQLTEALILGVLCFVCMAVMRVPYAPLISLIIGLTNLIPFFGPIFGTIPCAFLILMVDPFKAVIFVGMILLLQQVDSNLIYPKVVGDSVELPGVWVLISILIGGGLFGIAGMILGVPVFSVLYTVTKDYIKSNYRESEDEHRL